MDDAIGTFDDACRNSGPFPNPTRRPWAHGRSFLQPQATDSMNEQDTDPAAPDPVLILLAVLTQPPAAATGVTCWPVVPIAACTAGRRRDLIAPAFSIDGVAAKQRRRDHHRRGRASPKSSAASHPDPPPKLPSQHNP